MSEIRNSVGSGTTTETSSSAPSGGEGTHADTHLRNRLRSFSAPVQHRQQMHPFVAAVLALKWYKICHTCNEVDILVGTKVNADATCTRCHREWSMPHNCPPLTV